MLHLDSNSKWTLIYFGWDSRALTTFPMKRKKQDFERLIIVLELLIFCCFFFITIATLINRKH